MRYVYNIVIFYLREDPFHFLAVKHSPLSILTASLNQV